MITINNWSKAFETCDTRKRQRLGWFLAPSGCDSKGYRQLMRKGKDGIAALGVFQALCQIMATLPLEIRKGGSLINSDGTEMDLFDISEITRITPADLRQYTADLRQVGWVSYIEKEENIESADCLPFISDHLPQNSGFVKGEGEEQEKGKGKRTAPSEVVLPFGEPFKNAWQDWINYRKEIKKPLPASTVLAQLKKLSKISESDAVDMIENSIENAYQGLFARSQQNKKQNDFRPTNEGNFKNAGPDGFRPLYD